jgi:hypothetical protein
MKKIMINQEEMISLLKAGEKPDSYKVVFNEAKVEALDAILLGKNGFLVPEELIWYDDESINYDDDPGLTEDDIEAGRLVRVMTLKVPVDKEVANWIKKEKIDINQLAAGLIKRFYRNLTADLGSRTR